MNIENVNQNELNEIKAYVRGLIEGIKDTHKDPDHWLEDYWSAWDNTIEINICFDWSAPEGAPDSEKYICTLYAISPSGYTDYDTFQRLDYLIR